ncbi:MAG: hypothetical protein ACD_79C00174G0002 [uncultured bacterium]|nr:MAG: hypothetical protein ACD_79C00174G0002 [uncultured bacterium]
MKNTIQILFFLFIIKPFLTFFTGIRIFGRENLPKKIPFIMVANHSSHLDAATILSLFPLKELINIRPAAAADYFSSNAFRAFFSKNFFNILPIPRKGINKENNPLTIMKKAIKENQAIIIFPEGTRSTDGEMSNFKSGVAHLIQEHSEIPVIPIYLSNLYRSLPKGEFIPLPLFLEVNIGVPIFLSGDKKEIMENLYQKVAELKSKNYS